MQSLETTSLSGRISTLAVATGLLIGASGCSSAWFNSFLDPTQLGNFRENVVHEIQQTISFRDTPAGIPNAVDPTPEDRVQTVEEYEIGVGDALSVRILDFLARDSESEFTPTVDELGYLYIPSLGYVHVEGMTARELRSEIVQRAKNAGIFRSDSDPTVVISFLAQQQRIYNVAGTVQAPGRYRIIPPDFRLREAINQAGGLDPSVKTIYVIRNEPKPRRVRERGVHSATPASEAPEAVPAPPVSPVSMSEMAPGPVPPTAPAAQPGTKPATKPIQDELALPGEQNEKELLEVVSPVPSQETGATQTQSASPAEPAAPQPGAPQPFIFINDRFVPVSPGLPATPATVPGATEPGATTPPPASQPQQTAEGPVDWQELVPGGEQRIIRVPADKLSRGDSNYNIVIEPNDFIRLDAGQVGVFYLMGHVARPGVYSLTGQEITLRQAIAAAGGLDALAWPTRCEITRRIDGDREEITQWDLARIIEGQDPDLFLKPDDVVNVGTHAIAPLLATIRNSFRLTYGFGFVYDRNFADIDAVTPQQNPKDIRRAQLQQRFPGLFP